VLAKAAEGTFGTGKQPRMETRRPATFRVDLQADEDEEEEVDWSQLAKDNVFRHLMNSVDDGDAQQAGDVKKFVAGRAIVGKELTC
jgi:hypothetical protein